MCPYLGTVTTAGVFMTEVGWRGAPHTGPKGRGGDLGLKKKSQAWLVLARKQVLGACWT